MNIRYKTIPLFIFVTITLFACSQQNQSPTSTPILDTSTQIGEITNPPDIFAGIGCIDACE